MRLLLDTHIALWAILDDRRLPAVARDLIRDERNDVIVSAASIREIAIKHALALGGPNDMPISGQDALMYFRQSGYDLLAVSAEHTVGVESLPPLHGDPFDRLLVAQAHIEPMRLITRDENLAGYGSMVRVV